MRKLHNIMLYLVNLVTVLVYTDTDMKAIVFVFKICVHVSVWIKGVIHWSVDVHVVIVVFDLGCGAIALRSCAIRDKANIKHIPNSVLLLRVSTTV